MFSIDASSATPPFQQICEQVSTRIENGELAVGERLPSVRGLATELGIAPNTVAKAYTALERAGLVEAAGRSGTRVAANTDGPRSAAAAAAAQFAERVRPLGISHDEVLSIVGAALRAAS